MVETLGVIVAALVAKALDRAEDMAVEDGEGALRHLVSAVRQSLSSADDQAGTMALERVEDAPDSPKRVHELAVLLDEQTVEDPVFRDELEGLVQQARAAGVDVDSISQVALGSQNVQSAGLIDSEVAVTFGARAADSRAPRSAS